MLFSATQNTSSLFIFIYEVRKHQADHKNIFKCMNHGNKKYNLRKPHFKI